MSKRPDFPPRIAESIQRWERQLRSLTRSLAHDLSRRHSAWFPDYTDSGKTQRLRAALCRSLARAFDGLPPGYSFLGMVDDLAERLRLNSWQLLCFIDDGERSLHAAEIRAGSRSPRAQSPSDEPEIGAQGA